MDKSKEETEFGNDISPPSTKRVRRCVQLKLSWHKPRVEENCEEKDVDISQCKLSWHKSRDEEKCEDEDLMVNKPKIEEANAIVVEEEKDKCDESEIEGKKKGKSPAKTLDKDLKFSQSKLPWHNPLAEEAKVIVIEEERDESEESEGKKKGRRRKSLTRTPQKSPAKNKEARRSSVRNKSSKNCQHSKNKQQTDEDTPMTSPTSGDTDHGGSSSKKNLNNKRSTVAKDVGDPSMNTCPLTDLWLEAKMAAEENLRLSAGKQTHPFFTSRKTTKKLPQNQENKKMEMRYWPGLDGDYTVSCPPVHVFDPLEDGIASFDWKNWVFTKTSLCDLNDYCAIENASSVLYGSIKPLMLDNLHHKEMYLDQMSDRVVVQPLSVNSANSTSVDGQTLFNLDVVHLNGNISSSPRDICVDNLENKQQDKLLMERLTSYYQRISFWPECSLWTNKYQPENALEVCGNSKSVRFLGEWLHSWNERVIQSSNERHILEHCAIEDSEDSTYEIESGMDDEAILKSVLLITGPVGSGKSAAIYACAKEKGFEVIEVNTSDLRNGAHMKQAFGQAMDSHALNKWSVEDPTGHRRKLIFDLLSSPVDTVEDGELGNGSLELASRSCKQDATLENCSWNAPERNTATQAANKSLILFEDVDTVFDEDRGFVSSILHLAETAKRPIILTSNCKNPVLPQLLDRHVLDFTLPSSEELISHLSMICASEKANVCSNMLAHLVRSCLGDIRKTLMVLQFWCQGSGYKIDRETKTTYSPLAFDIDAAYLVLPRLIPWELQCKLSEKVVEEIDKAVAKVDENLQLMEAMPEELSSMEMTHLPKKRENLVTPVKAKKRGLLKRKSSFLYSTEPLDHANDLEDFLDASGSPETNARRMFKHRSGMVLSSQSDDGSADEAPYNSQKAPLLQTPEVINFLGLPIDRNCQFEMHDIVRQPLENFETVSVSHICDTFRSQDMSCVPESSFISGAETNGEDGFHAMSSLNISFNSEDSIMPVGTNNSGRIIIDLNKCSEDNCGSTHDIDVQSVNDGEEQGGFQDEDESPFCKFQLMDECSRADFSMQLLPGRAHECSLEVNLVQEAWRKLRGGRDGLKSYIPANRKDTSLMVEHVSGLSDLISEADIMFKSCYPVNNDILEPSMTPSVEPDICSFYEEQMEMGSTYAQHGLCFYTSKLMEVGSNLGHASEVDLAHEMLASSINTMALGKLLSNGKSTSKNSHLEGSLNVMTEKCSIATGREIESVLYNAMLPTVPARLSMVMRGFAFHEYVSFLSKISRLECLRLAQGIKKRSRASRHYLTSGSLSLSDEHVLLLSRSGYFKRKIDEVDLKT